MATLDEAHRASEADRHLQEAVELGNTAAANLIGGTGEVSVCELGILHALIALGLILRGS